MRVKDLKEFLAKVDDEMHIIFEVDKKFTHIFVDVEEVETGYTSESSAGRISESFELNPGGKVVIISFGDAATPRFI